MIRLSLGFARVLFAVLAVAVIASSVATVALASPGVMP